VPGLVLQPLVENAIKHAVARTVKGGALRLSARHADGRLWLTVADDGPGLSGEPAPGAGVGLRNTRERPARAVRRRAQRRDLRPAGRRLRRSGSACRSSRRPGASACGGSGR